MVESLPSVLFTPYSQTLSLPTLFFVLILQHLVYVHQDYTGVTKAVAIYQAYMKTIIQKAAKEPQYIHFLEIHYKELLSLSTHPMAPISVLLLSSLNSFLLASSLTKVILRVFPAFILHVWRLKNEVSEPRCPHPIPPESFNLSNYYESFKKEENNQTDSLESFSLKECEQQLISFMTVACYSKEDSWMWKDARCSLLAMSSLFKEASQDTNKKTKRGSKRRKKESNLVLPPLSNSLLVFLLFLY